MRRKFKFYVNNKEVTRKYFVNSLANHYLIKVDEWTCTPDYERAEKEAKKMIRGNCRGILFCDSREKENSYTIKEVR